VETAGSIRWADEARRSRHRLYPTTVVYSLVATVAFAFALRSSPSVALAYWIFGVLFWTWAEYLVHRFILHGVFADGPGFKWVLHRLFDHLHVEHHQRPWDGAHINGTIKDTGPFLGPVFVLALFLPPYTLLAFLAGFTQAYVIEEWIHHSVHFYHFDNRYFRYIKAHHLYHHSKVGAERGYGLTSGSWDVVYGTRFPAEVRAALYAPLRRPSASRRGA
jgi:dihydroceramide fatty acyl 2-hydroxylase